ncbi:MAG: polyhydroxyalkanoic acid system family protein [Lysobacteraceae bacterium]
MANIFIERKHPLSIKDARAAVSHVAEKLSERFDIEWEWSGNTLDFHRSGVSGHIKVSKGLLVVSVELGFLMGAFRGSIEREIEQTLDREFADR